MFTAKERVGEEGAEERGGVLVKEKATAVHLVAPAPFVDPISVGALAETVEKLVVLSAGV